MKLADFPKTITTDETDMLIADNGSAVYKISPYNAFVESYGCISSYSHKQIFRGKDLGSTITAAHLNEIQNGSFKDLFVGDYWTIDNIKWTIADFNYFSNYKNHVVIISDVLRETAVIDFNIAKDIAKVENVFKTVYEYDVTNKISNVKKQGCLINHSIKLPSKGMVFGTTFERDNSDRKLAIFELNNSEARSKNFWVNDAKVVNGALKGTDVDGVDTKTSTSCGVRLVFAIG